MYSAILPDYTPPEEGFHLRSGIRSNYFSWQVTKFVLREVVGGFVMGTVVFLFIMLMFQAIRLADFIVGQQVPIGEVGRLAYFLMLSFIPIAIPIAFLFAILMGISRANSEGEIVGLQVSGIRLSQIYAPLAFFSIFVTAACLYLSLFTVPKGNRAFELLIRRLGNERVMSALKPGVFMDGFYGLVLFSEEILPGRNEMKRVFIYDEREEKMPLFITAQSGILRGSAEKGRLTLRLTDGTIHTEREDAAKVQQKINFEVYDINLDASGSGDFNKDYSFPSFTYDHMVEEFKKEKENDPSPFFRALRVEFHRRISLSFSCIVFSALGFFIGTLSQRGIRSTAILLCILVAVVYWLCYVAALTLASGGWIAPWVGIWAPNVLFLVVSYICYRRYRS